ncbi:uncharacterized protein K441DRAFT_721421 [Cenococcum geophilum 1.58]|uniref:uncharacterized protein n=1 Tax=Cenococcum geophilum 1.58 TaxID=794803 RepID=UPI00358DFF33|nr:hypothetical protein K441DRAFT_721421 [Cenococcum geophilum 1.58]
MPPSLARIITTLCSLPGVLISTIIFVPTSLLLHHYIRTHGPIPSASTAIKLNSRLYAIISLYLLLSIALPASLTPSPLPKLLLSNGQNDSYQRTAYHLSKLYDTRPAVDQGVERLRGAELRAPCAHVCVFRRRGGKLDKAGVAVNRNAAACGGGLGGGGAVEGGVGAGETGWGWGMGGFAGGEEVAEWVCGGITGVLFGAVFAVFES